MLDDREKLLQVMSSLESDYRSGKISAEKYRYFRSKYEDKLNSIDALEATKRIRSMQGKSSPKTNKRRSKKPTIDKKKQQEDLVQKYIINPKKDDAKYNKKKKSSMGSGTFKLIATLVLIIAFTAGVAYGIFNFDSETVSDTSVVAIVEDTAFPEIVAVVNTTSTNVTDNSNSTYVEDTTEDTSEDTVETTTDTSTETTSDDTSSSSSSSSSSSYTQEPSSTDSGSSSSDSGGSSDSGSSSIGGSDSGGSSEE